MKRMRESGSTDGERIMEIRRRAVDVAHDFLSPEDHRYIENEVAAFLPGALLDLAVDETDRMIGFMLILFEQNEFIDSLL